MAQTNQVNLDIEDEPPSENTHRNAIHRVDSTSRQTAPRTNIGLGDRLNSVFREIRPLVEHARMVRYIKLAGANYHFKFNCFMRFLNNYSNKLYRLLLATLYLLIIPKW